MEKYLEVIVPIWNEEKNLTPLVERLDRTFKRARIPYRVYFVDDRSTDNSVKVLANLSKKYPVKILKKKGKKGKAFSILEAVPQTKSRILAMMDGDLQYPPEAIPEMLEKIKNPETGVVIASRQYKNESLLRKVMHLCFEIIFARFISKLNYDVQSGLKVFRKEVVEKIDKREVSPWTFDLPLLYSALSLGYGIDQTKIIFSKRNEGKSSIHFVKSSLEIAVSALRLKRKQKKIIQIKSPTNNSMLNTGIIYRGKRFVTHTGLEPEVSAIETFVPWQKRLLILGCLLFTFGLLANFLLTLKTVVAFLSGLYFIDALFNFYLVVKSLNNSPELSFSDKQIRRIHEKALPVYSILCPLYREAEVLPTFLAAIENLDWPKNKLDVQLLLEEDDLVTRKAALSMRLPKYVKVRVVPHSLPKTKPKACNFGLAHARGEYLVIYDAEDIPERDQLKKAYLGFKKVPEDVICLQAKLNYFNPHQNLLTRLFTAEYSLWFDLILPGFQSIQTNIPLGGTSNHFKVKKLLEVKGWDPFNVTEDCDLGVRLFVKGYKTAIIDSTTLEEANSNLKNWVRQRSRWIKGYMQTYLVHMRSPRELLKKEGWHGVLFQFVVGGKILSSIINPFFWITTIGYFVFYRQIGAQIESIYPSVVFYLSVFAAVFGNFLYFYYYMIGVVKKEQYSLVKFIFLIPFYWMAISAASFIALYQLFVKPHYWEKTVHGLHLKKKKEVRLKKQGTTWVIPMPSFPKVTWPSLPAFPIFARVLALPKFSRENNKLFVSGGFLILATGLANFLSFLLNAYLGRRLSVEEFGVLSVFTATLTIIGLPLSALSATISHRCAYLLGRYSRERARSYLRSINGMTLNTILLVTLFWAGLIPLLERFFHIGSLLPFIIFSPVWLISLYTLNISGYFRGVLSFQKVALMMMGEALIKLVTAYCLVKLNLSAHIYAILPVSLLAELGCGFLFLKLEKFPRVSRKSEFSFSFPFFITTTLSGLSIISFTGLDLILAKHYLSDLAAGEYSLLSLVGKVIFFLGGLCGPFMLPIVSRNEGANRRSRRTFTFLFTLTLIPTLIAYIAFGWYGNFFAPLLFGENTISILPYLPLYSGAMMLFTISTPMVNFLQAKKDYSFALVSFTSSLLLVMLLSIFHEGIGQIVGVEFVVSLINLALMVLIFSFRRYSATIIEAFKIVLDLPARTNEISENEFNLSARRILIFNWRDTKHVWAGGAEVYVQELASRLVKQGDSVTVFCGNDGHHRSREKVDGVNIVRKGGFYTVYIWAFIYYLIWFRGKFDFILESANGIPFFTPIYSRIPKVLLIHHIHQEVFREHLSPIQSFIARFVESKLMPLVYRSQKIVTVSQSSKQQILKLKLFKDENILVINPGVNLDIFYQSPKTKDPSFIYLGRLKPHKNVDVALKAFKNVLDIYPKASLQIAGFGECRSELEELGEKLGVERSVSFLGKVSEKKKVDLLSRAWAAVQPSMIEGWGITIIEANAAGTPVIASNVCGLKDSVINGKTGVLVKPKNIDEFSSEMIRLIEDDRLRFSLSKQALEWSRKFDWKWSADTFSLIIKEAVSEKSQLKLWRRLRFNFSGNT